jgi:uncharacterized protein (TIGR02391 family)
VNRIDHGKIEDGLLAALRDTIKAGKSIKNAVRISEFKRSNLERWLPNEALPDRTVLINMFMWEHLKGRVNESLLNEIDDVVDTTIQKLQDLGLAKRGGRLEDTVYPEDDWVLLTPAGVKKLTSGEPVFHALTDDDVHFDQRQFYPDLVTACRKLFIDGHYAQAVFEACKLIVAAVKTKSGASGDGSSLMTQVFSLANPMLRFNDLKNQSDKDEQQGFMHIFQGVMLGIRNPGAHEFVTLKDRTRALEYLSLLSLLLRRLDETKK